jgi:transaldolase
MNSHLLALQNHGQSIWLDSLSRCLITSGELKRLISDDGLRGLTSNPAIFEKAIVGSGDYCDLLDAPEAQGLEAQALYERLVVRDIQAAADLFCPMYLSTTRRDGYVSLEVSPQLAHSAQGTIEEARRLWHMVGRENLMIKVPGTPEGIAAFRQLISEGINVNVTMLFSTLVYEEVAASYIDALEHLVQRGGDPGKVTSVASFFISRIDTGVDEWIGRRLKPSANPEEQVVLRGLLGKVAIASAKVAYQRFLAIFRGYRWEELRRHGAHAQRLLWASTGTKNPDYSDVRYVEELIGPDTVSTLPPATLSAFRDHGRVWFSLAEKVEKATGILAAVEHAGLPLKEITDKLLADGVRQFSDAFARVLKVTDRRAKDSVCVPMDLIELKLMKELYEGGRHQ